MGADKPSRARGHRRLTMNYRRMFIFILVFLVFIVIIHLFFIDTDNSATHFIKTKVAFLTNPFSKAKSRAPLHILLLSYTRTGSTFLGGLLESLPDSFFHCEPLMCISVPVMKDSFREARLLLHKLFTCKVSHLPGYMDCVNTTFLKNRLDANFRKSCSRNNSCFIPGYMDSHCRQSSTVIIKTTRLGLEEAAKLFDHHPDLNLKIVYLVRDPRGTMNSRAKYPVSCWCEKDPLCFDSKMFCASLARDVNAICSMLSTRYEDFAIVRYEDLAISPYETANRLVKFLGMNSLPIGVVDYIKKHTGVNGKVPEEDVTGPGEPYEYITFRNSSMTAVRWRQEISFERLLELQNHCEPVLTGFGYPLYNSVEALKSKLNFDTDLNDSLTAACSPK